MKIFIGFLLTACVVVFGVFFATPSTNGQKEQKEEATVVKKGQVTEKEREYSKEYKKQSVYQDDVKLSERRKEIQDFGVIIGELDTAQDPEAPVVTAAQFLNNLSCNADAIVLGSAKSKLAHLTEDETFVYTEYDFSVQDILKNNLVSPIEVNSTIQITRPGGLIKLDNRRIKVEDKSYEPLELKKQYLLFLRFVPSANGYMVASPKGDFVLEGNSFRKISKLPLPNELGNNADSRMFLSNIRNSLLVGCSLNSMGGK